FPLGELPNDSARSAWFVSATEPRARASILDRDDGVCVRVRRRPLGVAKVPPWRPAPYRRPAPRSRDRRPVHVSPSTLFGSTQPRPVDPNLLGWSDRSVPVGGTRGASLPGAWLDLDHDGGRHVEGSGDPLPHLFAQALGPLEGPTCRCQEVQADEALGPRIE